MLNKGGSLYFYKMTRLIYVYLTALICLGVSSAMDVRPDSYPGRPHRGPMPRGLTRSTVKCENGDSGLKCANCTHIMFCDNAQTNMNIRCSMLSSGNDYCDDTSASCTSTPPGGCEFETNSDRICYFEGFQPDPESCTSYYYCESVGTQAMKKSCPPNTVYVHNATFAQCKVNADCVKMDCQGKKYANYPPDQSIFGKCDNNEIGPLSQCSDAEHEWFVVDKAKCMIVCRVDNEIFADKHDEEKYYHCYISGNQWYLRHDKCHSGKKFDSDKSACVKK